MTKETYYQLCHRRRSLFRSIEHNLNLPDSPQANEHFSILWDQLNQNTEALRCVICDSYPSTDSARKKSAFTGPMAMTEMASSGFPV